MSPSDRAFYHSGLGSGLGGFFAAIGIVLGAVGGVRADESACVGTPAGNPNPLVEKAISDPRCAIEDDFRNSCAYRDLEKKETASTVEDFAKRFAQVLDPTKVPPTPGLAVIHAAAAGPRFFRIFETWEALKRPMPAGPDGYPDSLKRGFTPDELGKFQAAMRVVKQMDATDSFLTAVGLLATLPGEAGKNATPEERVRLLGKIYRNGLDYRDRHSAGCRGFRASLENFWDGETRFGPLYKDGSPTKNLPDARKDAIQASETAVNDRRNVAGATEKLQACGYTDAKVRKATRKIEKKCEIELPVRIFEDNRSDLSPDARSKLLAAIDNDPCYREKAKKTETERPAIQKIAIATSANTLHNTANYCERGFRRLSEDRASTIEAAMRSHFTDRTITYDINSDGGNGDGSSGPCAYFAKEEKASTPSNFSVEEKDGGATTVRHFSETPVPEYDSAEGKKALEPYKYARTTIYFEDRSTPIDGHAWQWSALTNCRNVRYDCR
jgi:hypothetical protein